MTIKYSHGLPYFGSVTDADELILAETLCSADDIPNAANAAVGNSIVFDSVNGMRSYPQGADGANIVLYNGPGAAAWNSRHTELATYRGFTISFEVHRDAIDTGATGLAGTNDVAVFHFRAATGNGTIGFGRGGTVAGHSIASSTISCQMKSGTNGITAGFSYLNTWANDKDFVPIVMEIKRGRIRIYVDGLLALSIACTSWATTDLDDFWLAGRQYAANSTPAGFPYWFRNLQIINRRLTLPINPYADRMTCIGDSFALQGDYDYTMVKDNSSHRGWNCDAGHTPMLERLFAREGIFVNDIHNSGESGARLLYVATGANVLTQVNGSPTSAHYDATTSRGKIAYVLIGTNDAHSETTTIEDLRTALNTLLDAILAVGFEQILLCELIDSSATGDEVPRIEDINAMYAEEADLRTNVTLIPLYDEVGPYDADRFESSSPIHPAEEINSIIGRAIAAVAIPMIRNWNNL